MKKNMLKFLSAALICTLILQTPATACFAWEQPAHKRINGQAAELFSTTYAKSSKYSNAKINLYQLIDAPVVTTSGKFYLTYNQSWSLWTASSIFEHGGFSADEPNVYVSVKHFYDPLALSGKHELTDQSSVHGKVYEAIPATDWALLRGDNPYSLTNAMKNYKKCMEIPSDTTSFVIPATGDFRDFAGTALDAAQLRSMYLGKGIRGIGEVSHLVADMTQPAHVRNDSHPGYEITEQAITGPVAANLVKFPRMDGLTVTALGSTTLDLMKSLATWTNANFYSADSIADATLKVSPYNGEKAYSSPQLSGMTTGVFDTYKTWFANFNGKKVPMVSLEPDWVFDNYIITKDAAIAQAEVLLPLAVSSCARVMDLFFPTLTMEQTVTEEVPAAETLSQATAAGAEELKQYSYDAVLTHQVAQDEQWKTAGLTISYSGPGEIHRIRNRKDVLITKVEFKNGKIVQYQDPITGEMTDGKPDFYLPLGAEKKVTIGGNAVDYIVEMNDSLYVRATAGLQNVQSATYTFEEIEPEITLTADRTSILPGEKVEFTAKVENAPERYKLEWTFGDEEDQEEQVIPPVLNRKTTMKHTYEKSKDYTAKVRIYDLKRKIYRAEDTVVITSKPVDLEGTWNITLEVKEENKFFRSIVVSIMKLLVDYIFAPLISAISGETVDSSTIDNFTFVGTTLDYTLDLQKTGKADQPVYQGPLTFIGSNTGYLEGNGDLSSLRMENKNGTITFVGIGTDESGNPVEIDFLTDGKMISETEMQGKYNIAGVMSGTWTATKK